MATSSKKLKEILTKLLLPPENNPVKELVDKYNIHEQILYRWHKTSKE